MKLLYEMPRDDEDGPEVVACARTAASSGMDLSGCPVWGLGGLNRLLRPIGSPGG